MKSVFIFCGFILLNLHILCAAVINVPGDQPTIQDGINAAVDGDTVLVQPGIYVENIDFGGKNITVASLFLTTQDQSYITQTIIDGNQSGSVVLFINGENSNAILCGFTITNGNGYTEDSGFSFGGGIYINNSSPTLDNLTITENTSNEGAGIVCKNSNAAIYNNFIHSNNTDEFWGGGIMCEEFNGIISNNTITNNQTDSGGGIELYSNSSPLISNNIIAGNTATSMGGGILLYTYCSPNNKNNIIYNNEANVGGAIFLHYGSDPVIENNTISNNTANVGGVIYSRYFSAPTIINSIFWDNSSQEIYCNDLDGINEITVSYSNIDGGQQSIENGEIHWLEGNIDSDPLFVNPANGDYHISDGSPCIDAGNAEEAYNDVEDPANLGSALYPSFGGLRNDMGAYGGPGVLNWLDPITSISMEDETQGIDYKYILEQNYPNPFNSSTKIRFSIPRQQSVRLDVFDMLGRKITTLLNNVLSAGTYTVDFNCENKSSGIYFYKITAGENISVKKMILLR